MDPTLRFRIATRIHFALLRHFGEDVQVDSLLKGEGEAREALWVCEASGDPELAGLARRLERRSRAPRRGVGARARAVLSGKLAPATSSR
ncbi:MAG: hypothetical protein ABIP61_07720 [Burkholderiaceae bacterium]